MNTLTQSKPELFASHTDIRHNLSRPDIISTVIDRREVLPMQSGALATWNPDGETGRIPQDTYFVDRESVTENVDWTSSNCVPMTPAVFESLWSDALAVLKEKDTLFSCDKTIGAESATALPTTVISDHCLPMLFVDNMFRPVPNDIETSLFADQPFTLLVLPYDKIDTSKYGTNLRHVNGEPVDMLIAMDFEKRQGLVYGLSYLGGIKKTLFTVMNYLLPQEGILPLHCSANIDANGKSALLLGLSGTGKTTLSNHPGTTMIGDDEHLWSGSGIANMENGCYAKLINLDPNKEPEIYDAAFTNRPVDRNGVIIENAMVYTNGTVDLNDSRLTLNSRTSYPLNFLEDFKEDAVGPHPDTVLFLTADAKGVLPPVAKLSVNQALLWFLMGYTSKLAGTEVGVKEPKASFSRFFGGAFMPRNPIDYINLLRSKLEEHGSDVYLVNTGWAGGAYGTGKRMDITASRGVVEAALNGELKNAEYREDSRFHFSVPVAVDGVEAGLLDPRSQWENPEEFDAQADNLAREFSASFDAMFGSMDLPESLISQCPGK